MVGISRARATLSGMCDRPSPAPVRRSARRRPPRPGAARLARALALGLSALAAAACGGGPDGPERPPNVVLLISDDHDWEHLGFTGHPADPTPALDALAARGTVFELAHAAPRCRPTLAGLLSGRHGHQTGVYANGSRVLLRGANLLPRLLARAGYRTYAEGKFWEGNPREVGFRHGPEQTNSEYGLETETFVRADQRELFDFLGTPSDRPFFVWWAPRLPHTPHDPPADLLARFADTPIEVPPWIEPAAREAFVEAERTDLAMAAWLDRGVGELVDRLDELGELERTLFVFLIDNGWANGYLSKGTPYEKAVRTPLVFAGPGVPGGERNGALASYLDVMPTVLDWAGLEPPARCEGTSLRPQIEGRTDAGGRGRLYGALFPKNVSGENRPEQDLLALWARGPRWKYVVWTADLSPDDADSYGVQHRFLPAPTRTRGQEELYDLASDPYELEDLAGLPEHAEQLARMRVGTEAWWLETGGRPLGR